MNTIELSHTIRNGQITYKGLPAPYICDFLSREDSRANYEKGTEFHIGQITLVANTGTYIDTPFHRFSDGEDLSQISLSQIAGLKGLVCSIPKGVLKITKEHIPFSMQELKGKALLIHTGHSQFFGKEKYFYNHPYVCEELALFLKESEVVLVGIDSYNIDNTQEKTRPVHTILLGSNILIVEHMTNLEAILQKEFEFFAIPPKIEGMGTFPVRAFARSNSFLEPLASPK